MQIEFLYSGSSPDFGEFQAGQVIEVNPNKIESAKALRDRGIAKEVKQKKEAAPDKEV